MCAHARPRAPAAPRSVRPRPGRRRRPAAADPAAAPTRRARPRPAARPRRPARRTASPPAAGARRAAAAISVDRTGFALCGIADEPPPLPSATSRDLGTGQGEHVGGDLAQGARREGQRPGEVRDRGAQGVPRQRRVRARPSSRAYGGDQRECGVGRPNAVKAAKVPAAPPSWAGSAGRTAVEPVPGVQHQRAPARRLQPEGRRHGVLGEGAARHRGVAVLGGERGQRALPCGRGRRGSGRRVRAATSIVAVSMMSWLVAPRWT